jgi:hypothetical protein
MNRPLKTPSLARTHPRACDRALPTRGWAGPSPRPKPFSFVVGLRGARNFDVAGGYPLHGLTLLSFCLYTEVNGV